LRPLAWLMGVSWQYAGEVGNLMGIKISLNEFVAYSALSELIHTGTLDQKSIVIATYALCGFANFASIGIQIGGISSLAPGRRSDLSKVALKAMFGGALASWMTATIAGLLL
ncbi:MAG: NupC/NupG family nucleoside CNT transporter, partial [Candidatus Marinimicrobia bacterium]|nr:NupC/NupG family nucleoside CNT transporter [Candidatus Neomarinimicrobiota bacterium]